jgi:integrase
MRDINLSEDYVDGSKRILGHFREHCEGLGVTCVSKITAETAQLFHERYANKSGGTRRYIYAVTRCFLLFCGNSNALRYRVRVRGYCRQRIDWLTPIETEQILATPMTAREAVMIRAGLLQGTRRIEVVRMTIFDAEQALRTSVLKVNGKGSKIREILLHPGFAEALRAYLGQYADSARDDRLLPIGKEQVYKNVVDFSLRFGRRFNTHTLRRTFGRNLWLRGIPIETISELMGHSSTDMTRLYLGLNLSDMRKAISEYGTKSEMRIIEKIPERRIAPPRPKVEGTSLENDDGGGLE